MQPGSPDPFIHLNFWWICYGLDLGLAQDETTFTCLEMCSSFTFFVESGEFSEFRVLAVLHAALGEDGVMMK